MTSRKNEMKFGGQHSDKFQGEGMQEIKVDRWGSWPYRKGGVPESSGSAATQLLHCMIFPLVHKHIQTLNWGYVSTNIFISAMLSTFWWFLAFFWNSSINSFMVCPVSPKFEYKFWKQHTTVITQLCLHFILLCFILEYSSNLMLSMF